MNSLTFKSSCHTRYQNGEIVAPLTSANRVIKAEISPNRAGCYTVAIYNTDGLHPLWQDNMQMAPKIMKMVSATDSVIKLNGFGCDPSGFSYEDYALTIYLSNQQVIRCILHLTDRKIDIDYH